MPFFRVLPLIFLGGCLLVQSGSFDPAFAATPVAKKPTPKRPAHQKVRSALFAHLEQMTGTKAPLPVFPSQKLRAWVEQRAEKASQSGDDKVRYTVLFEHLLIAEKLLSNPDLITRKQGFLIANESANFTATHLKTDKWLLARLYEGFLLPNVSLAHLENWQDPSRQRVLEMAVSIFGSAGEPFKQISVLEWLLGTANKPKNPSKVDSGALVVETNTLDWARGTLASLLVASPNATNQELKRALSLLQSIESPDMQGFKHLQESVKARLDTKN